MQSNRIVPYDRCLLLLSIAMREMASTSHPVRPGHFPILYRFLCNRNDFPSFRYYWIRSPKPRRHFSHRHRTNHVLFTLFCSAFRNTRDVAIEKGKWNETKCNNKCSEPFFSIFIVSVAAGRRVNFAFPAEISFSLTVSCSLFSIFVSASPCCRKLIHAIRLQPRPLRQMESHRWMRRVTRLRCQRGEYCSELILVLWILIQKRWHSIHSSAPKINKFRDNKWIVL